MRNTFCIIVTALIVLLAGCSKENSTPEPPAIATLSFPAQNSACTTGTVISPTQSTINFTWNAAANATSYDVTVKNLITGISTTQTSGTNQLAVNLSRDTPYSWFVVSKSNVSTVTTQSETWRFYNAGLGSVSHPPFPADVLKPTFGQSVTAVAGNVNLSWTGTDPDNDILNYDVYFGTAASPAIFKAAVSDMFSNNVSVTSGTTYYWKVITRDAQGNTSDSGVFQFKVN